MSGPMLKHSPTCEWLRRRCNCGAAARDAAPLGEDECGLRRSERDFAALLDSDRPGLDVDLLQTVIRRWWHTPINVGPNADRVAAEWIAAEYARLEEPHAE